MDNTDLQIIAELRRNARASLSDLASTVGVSRVTVRARLTRLQDDGVIIGFTAILADDLQTHPVRANMMLGIEGKGTDRIIRQLGGFSEVQAIHTTNGKWDVIVEIGTQTLVDLDTVLAHIRKLDGVTTSETNLLLKTQMTNKSLRPR